MKRFALLLGLLLQPTLMFSQAASAPKDPLVGVWSTQHSFGPFIRGELTIDGRANPWRARIAGFDVPVQRDDQTIRFSLPGEQGEFRGSLRSNTLVGHWIQAPAVALGRAYASPITLSPIARGVWLGTVKPLESRLTFFLTVQAKADGTHSAYLRNPEHNWFGRGVYAVQMSDDQVTFTRGRQKLSGNYDTEDGSLYVSLVDGSGRLRFVRTDADMNPGAVPRAQADGYSYRPPIDRRDGWSVASLADVGMDPQPLTELVNKILHADRAENALAFHSILIARHGKLVFEEYFYGTDADQPHDMRSASKTFATMMVGLARDRGAKIDPQSPALALFRQYSSIDNIDERKRNLRLEDLMNMTSGLCDDSDPATNEDSMQQQSAQPDWIKYALDLPMRRAPGTEPAVYCSSNLNLVGAAVRAATGRWLPELFHEAIATPLGFGDYYMNLMPTGEAYMGGGMYVRPRDQLKVAQVYLNGGMWNGRRVLSAGWVKEALRQRSSFVSAGDFDPPVHGYGHGWHTRERKVGGRTYRDFFMGGNGGQNVIVLPDLDMVIVFTGGNYGEAAKFYRWELELMPQYIIPAVKDAVQR